jgi:tetratricopeptide (TPR) repeat protein
MGPTVTDNLVKTLSRRSGLRVTSSHLEPSFYGPQAVSPQKVGRDLHADAVFFGRIRQHGNDLVLQTRLESVKDGSQIAEGQYTLNPDDLSLLEQQVSVETALNLELPLNNDDKNVVAAVAARQNRKPGALELYLLGRHYWNKRDRENIQKAVDLFDQAIDQDPLFARAYAGLADCYSLMNSVAYGSLSTKEAMTKAEFAAKQAVKLDDSLPEAHTSLGVVLMRYHWDWENAEKEFKRAIELDPDLSPAHQAYSVLLSITGRGSESIGESETAMDREPFSAPAIMTYCRSLYLAREISKADACLGKLTKEYPNNVGAKYIHGLVYIQQGRTQEATQIFEEFYAKDKLIGGALLGFCYGITNRRAEAERVLNEMLDLEKQGHLPPQELAIIYLGLDDREHAFARLHQAAEDRFAPLQSIFVDPMFDRFRSDPKFIELAKELKLPSRSPA